MRGYLPESQYNTKTREIIDNNPRALQWCSTQPQPQNLVSLDICKCYPSILINNKEPIPLYTIHDIIRPFSEHDLTYNYGEYYIDEYVFNSWAKGIKIEAGFYTKRLVQMLINGFKMPTSDVKYFIRPRKTLAPDTFKNFLLKIFELLPESQAKFLENSYIGELGRKYSRKDHGFTCNDIDTAQCISTSALAENRDVTIDSYQNPSTKQEIYLIRERQMDRILSANTSINRFVISEAILKCLKLITKNCSHDENGHIISEIYTVNTDGVFMTNSKYQYPNKKDVKFEVSNIGKIFQTDSLATYFEKHYRENYIPDNYTDQKGNGVIYFGGKTYKLCEMASKATNPIILSFTNKATENVKNVFKDQYPESRLEFECYTFDRYFCDCYGRDITNLKDKTIFIEEYSMTPNRWMTKMYHAFTKFGSTIYMFGDTNQCDPVEKPSKMHYDYFKSASIKQMCPGRIEMKYIDGEKSRYDIPTKNMLTEFLNTGTISHKFPPKKQSYHNICYLNETGKGVTEACCNRFTKIKTIMKSNSSTKAKRNNIG